MLINVTKMYLCEDQQRGGLLMIIQEAKNRIYIHVSTSALISYVALYLLPPQAPSANPPSSYLTANK